MLKAVVIGGGIGGLAAGIALENAGVQVDVFERAAALREVGAGISLWVNALAALKVLGLDDDVRAAGFPDVHGGLRTWRGRALTDAAGERALPGVCVIHRAQLHALLLTRCQALAQGRVHLGATCVGVEQDGTGVTAMFQDGRRARADVLIGADGLHSVIRAHLHGQHPPAYAGYTGWRAVVTFDHRQLQPGESWGAGMRFGHLPMSGGRVYWYATKNAPEGERSAAGDKAELLARLRGWHTPVEALVAATDETAILRNDIYDRPVLKAWGSGRITLLGDAAHPMTPNLGQGACQALEDAVVLAGRLRRGGDVVSALRRYEAIRIPRANWIVNQSKQIGAVGQWQSPLAVAARNFLMTHLGPRLQGPAMARVADAGLDQNA